MARFLIEVTHENDFVACAQAIRLLLSTGSPFLTNADWGCPDGEHKAWVVVDVDNKAEARSILPSELRLNAKIVQLNKYTMEEVDNLLKNHQNSLA